ncbi:uncharacterized protein B0P05DRAFT_540090 [Gilbertella persicaria]|uniref:protein-histidine N-methyltransferase n=1 Tax=Rhizopus stolonifer TaxID=4846 RepID=A0A367JFV7_RHIST|nr:uncharacterized protein B0P05DRAFT_540090 [Gilbertella persicaria]KAI8080130.1 hypothetical protein B0P05DRAFT_540090 [Gilbertella persicaria]RCH88838.1 hypothetical protein CU098_005175 [Rhizopus stolonifer]
MAFKFNFTNEELDLEDSEESQQLETSLSDLNIDEKEELNKIPSQKYNILSSPLPNVIQADILQVPTVEKPIYKRTLADVKFQMAEQDNLVEDDDNDKDVINMLNLSGNTDLIRGVYEGGFKTWECSIDMVQYLHGLPKEQISNKRVLELGCGSSLPSIYLLSPELSNQVDVQDYNEQVIRYITIPNILLNTVLTVQDPATVPELIEQPQEEKEQSSESEAEEDEEDEDEEKRIEEDAITCDAEAEIVAEKIPEMLGQVNKRTRAFFGDWSSLPEQLNVDHEKYDMIVTSETIYAEHALPDLINVFQKALKKPDGVCYVAAKTVYFGVGGGILPFCSLLDQTQDSDGDKLKFEKVFESSSTVKREILKVSWSL